MPITKSAKKSLRQSKKRRKENLRRLKVMRDIIKNIRDLTLENKKNAQDNPRQRQDKAKKLLPEAYKAIDKTAKMGIIKKNTAARKKSRLTKLINKIGEEKPKEIKDKKSNQENQNPIDQTETKVKEK